MISRTQAERIGAAMHTLRTDWPAKQIVTLITTTDAGGWPLRDLVTALAYIAVDQNLDGSWASDSPYRVLGDGPWLKKLDTAGGEHARQRSLADARDRLEQIKIRNQAIAHCTWCDNEGRLDNGHTCPHDQPPAWLAERARNRAAAARAAIRPAPRPNQPKELSA